MNRQRKTKQKYSLRAFDIQKKDFEVLLMVTRLGFEPKTHSLEGCCSIQLSYQAIAFAGANVRLFFKRGSTFAKKKQKCCIILLTSADKDDADAWVWQASQALEWLLLAVATS